MIKTLKPFGNSLGLIIDKPILDLLKIDRTTRLEITTDGEGLLIRPVRPRDTAPVSNNPEPLNDQAPPDPEPQPEPLDIGAELRRLAAYEIAQWSGSS